MSIQLIEDDVLKLEDNNVNYGNDERRDICDYFGTYRVSALILGASGSGKTTWLLNFITNKRRSYDIYILILPRESTLGGLYKMFVDAHPKNAFMFILGEETLPNISELTELNKKKGKICLILDDWTSTRNRNDLNQIKAYFTQISRASADFFCLAQDYQAVPSSIRPNANIVIMFVGALTKRGMNIIFMEWYKSQFMEKPERERILKLFGPAKYMPLIMINGVDASKSMIFNDSYVLVKSKDDVEDSECGGLDSVDSDMVDSECEDESEELTKEDLIKMFKH